MPSTTVNITGLDKAAVLAALYNASKPQGMSFLQFVPTPMTIDDACKELDKGLYFDYLKGRVMKVDLTSDTEVDVRLYDRDNGEGASQRAIDALR